MTNSIPESYLFKCELFQNIERIAIEDYGRVNPEILEMILMRKINAEHNSILIDLYRQMLERITQLRDVSQYNDKVATRLAQVL